MPEQSITTENTIYYTGQVSESSIHLLYAGNVIYLPHGNIELHTHGHYELCLFTKGPVKVTVGNKAYTIHPGDLLLSKPGDLHSVESLGFEWGKLYIGVDQIIPDELGSIFKHCDKRVFPKSQSLEWIFRHLIAELKERKYGMSIAVENLLELLIVSTTRIIEPNKKSDKKGLPESVALARFYIESHPYHDLDLAAVANYSCLSISRLSCVFVRETGMTLKNYLKYVIMHRALRLLEDDNKSISEIAKEFNYPSVQYFSTVFKNFWTYTPRAYRSSVRKNVPYRH